MPLTPGSRLGVYEVLTALGAGGMGEVYRARDTRLNRDVALKILPQAFADDGQRMARFEREAQLLASLNHPNIAQIYGFEHGPAEGGHDLRAIVMELVEGVEVMGPIPLAEALQVARQIAEAIEFAHEKGVIHRDLKPANIKRTSDGVVKVLDFGLAKALDVAAEANAETRLAMSPTLSLGATQAGLVLGTAPYMAPEQAKGKSVDRRSDVWAFGVVLYELLTGQRLFGGETVAETLAAVMKDPIVLEALPSETPRAIRRLLARCLERDLRRRLQSIGEARIVIEDVIAGSSQDEVATPAALPARAGRATWVPWAVTVVVMLAAASAVGWSVTRPATVVPKAARFTIPPPDGTALTTVRTAAPQVAMSPDGRYVAFVADEPGRGPTIWIRALDSLAAQRLDRTEGAMLPFWSPDSQHIGYFADGKLMRVSVAGGAPLTIGDAPDGEGGTWFQDGDEGVIVFAPNQNGPLHRVLARGGVSTAVTTLREGESAHAYPQWLPDGRRILYTARGEAKSAGVYVQVVGSGERTRVMDGVQRTVYGAPGFLLYTRDGVLLAHRWNLDTLALEGEPVSIAEDVRVGVGSARSAFAVSSGGELVYRGYASEPSVRVRWYGRNGTAGAVVLEPGVYRHLELSPDGTLLAVSQGTANDSDLWVKDLSSGAFSRITSERGPENQEAWSPDSRHIAYVGSGRLFWTTLGTGRQMAVPGSDRQILLEQWTPDSKYLIARAGVSTSLVAAPHPERAQPGAADKPQEVFSGPYGIDHVRASPDGKWVSYTSEESGRSEVMVARFPSFTDRRQISLAGGEQAQWRADGKELFFHAPDQRMMAVEVIPGDTLRTGPVRELFRTNPSVLSAQVYMYAATPDGQRFLLREPAEGTGNIVEPLYVVMNWQSLVGGAAE